MGSKTIYQQCHYLFQINCHQQICKLQEIDGIYYVIDGDNITEFLDEKLHGTKMHMSKRLHFKMYSFKDW